MRSQDYSLQNEVLRGVGDNNRTPARGAAVDDILRRGAGCFGTGCRTPRASSAGMTSAWLPRSGTTTTGGCPRTPDWMAGGRRVKCAAGVGGDGDRAAGTVLFVSGLLNRRRRGLSPQILCAKRQGKVKRAGVFKGRAPGKSGNQDFRRLLRRAMAMASERLEAPILA